MTGRRELRRRLAVITLAAAALALILVTPANASDDPAPSVDAGSLRIHTTAIYADGRREARTLAFSGSPEQAFRSLAADDWVTVGSRVTNTSSWRSNSKVNYGTTELARENPGKRQMKKGAALVNRNRGVNTAPTHKIKNSKHDIIPESQFPNFSAYISQFHFDSRNTIVMDEEDEFVDFVPPALGAVGDDVDVFAVRYEYARVMDVAAPAGRNDATDRFEGVFWIEEADIYVRSDVFARYSQFELNVLLVFGFLVNSGYEQTGWTDDALGFVNPYAVTADAFDDKNSDMWMQHRARDEFYYRNVKTAANEVVDLEMLPIPHSVIDIGGNILWYEDTEPPLGLGPVLIQSKPSAYNGNRKAVTKISWIDPGPPARLRSLTTLKNNLEAYPRVDRGIPEPWYPLVRFNAIRIAKQKNLDQLVKGIEDHCVPMEIRGVSFPCVLPVRIRHSAYVSENGGKQTIEQDYYLINSAADRQRR